MTQAEWVAEILTWHGTKFKYQGRRKKGTLSPKDPGSADCGGLILGAAEALHYFPAGYVASRQYKRSDDMVAFTNAILAEHFTEVDRKDTQAGDIVTFHDGSGPIHIGVLYAHPWGGLGIVHTEDRQVIVAHQFTEAHARLVTQNWRPRYTDGK